MLKSIKEVQRALSKRETTVSQLCNQAYKIIEETQNLNAFITTKPKDEALKEAEELDAQLLEARPDVNYAEAFPLFGITVSVKDNFCTDQNLTTCGSKMLHNFVPPYDATVVQRLKQSKCIITGKTNMDEFAMGSSCTTSYYGPAGNSWKRESMMGKSPSDCDADSWYMAGGSSTGSAVSVASGACFASIGTDTGGSTRQPASLTGTVGFKPTYGLISRFGLIPLAHCLDVVSLLARSVDDVSVIFNQVIGQDENDLTSVDHLQVLRQNFPSTTLDDYKLSLRGRTIRIGLPYKFIAKGDLADDVAQQFAKIVESLAGKTIEGTKFELVDIDLPHSNLATECYTILSSTEIASNMSCYDGVKYGLSTKLDSFNREQYFQANRDAGFGPEVKKRILIGNYFLLEENRAKYFEQAQKMRRLISEDFQNVFEHDSCHVILLPSTPTTSISYAEWMAKQDDNRLFREDYYLIPANLANIPSISLPTGLSASTGLPIGLQLIANRYHDLDLLLVAKFFEQHVFEKIY